jgi:hypothetical protein
MYKSCRPFVEPLERESPHRKICTYTRQQKMHENADKGYAHVNSGIRT